MIEFITGFIAAHVVWFFLATVIIGGLCYNEHDFNFMVLVCLLLGIYFFSHWTSVSLTDNILNSILIYLGSGAIWTTIKWVITLFHIRKELKGKCINGRIRPDTNYHFSSEVDRFVKVKSVYQDGNLRYYDVSVNVANGTSTVLMWFAYWPISMAEYLITRFIGDILEFIYIHILKPIYNKLSRAILGDILE